MSVRRATKSSVTPAKISIPRLLESYPRPRLFRALDAARRKKVVWISAPAGAGKTSVVASYLAERRLAALWYNVDARDSDAANLFHYLTLAARYASPRRKLRLPAFAAENQQGVAAFACGFFEALYEQRPSPSIIVLDDYHDARADLFDEVMRQAIVALPKGISIIIIGRGEPPPLLVRMVASGDIALIGVAELRLSPKDIAGLVSVHRPDLRGARLKAALPRFVELANGWAAALTLLLQDPTVGEWDPRAVDQFSERLFDYFATEVFDQMTAVQCEFLLKTSVVPGVTPALASRLTGVSDAERTLDDLDRRSFLIQRFGDSGTYRYHPLLRDFLLRRAERDLGFVGVRELHHRAAEALLEAGQVDEAMEQFETAGDLAERSRLLLQLAPSYVATGRSRTIATWIARLPAEWVERDGWLLYWRALSTFGHWEERPLELLERAYALFARDRVAEGLHLTCAAAMQSVVHEGVDFTQLDVWIERFETLERDGPECPEPLQPMAATGMLMASTFRRPDAAHNRKWAERALALSSRSNDLVHRVITGGFLAQYLGLYDSPSRATAILEMLRAFASEATSAVLPIITVMQADALCAWLQGDNDTTLERIRAAQALSARTGVSLWTDFIYGLGVGCALSVEDFATVREFLELMAEIAQRRQGWPAGFYHFCAGWDALTRKDTINALHHAELAAASAQLGGPPFGRAVTRLLLAQVRWQAERAPEADEELLLAKRTADEGECAVLRCGCLLVESDLAWDHDRERALRCLQQALLIARECGYHNVFGLGRATLERAAIRALGHGIEVDHTRVTIRRHRLKPDRVPPRLEAWPWRYRIRILGPFELIDDRDPALGEGSARRDGVGGPRGMPLRMLQAIIGFGGRGVRDVRIIDSLWPDAEGDAGRRVLDTTLHRLRRQMHDNDFVRLSDGRFYLDERICWLDVWAFDDIAVQVEREVASGAPAALLVDLAQQLLGIYRGGLLVDEEGATSFAKVPRERLAAKFGRLAHLLGPALERTGEREKAAALHARCEEVNPSNR